MSALVKLALTGRAPAYLGLTLAPGVKRYNTITGMGVELVGGNIEKLSGEDAGGELGGTTVKAGQKVAIHLGDMKSTRYQTLVSINPELSYSGTAFAPAIIEPGDKLELAVVFKADKAVDLSKLAYIIRLYMVD